MRDWLVVEVRRIEPKLLEHYRHLHAHPELSYREEATARYVSQALGRLGLDEIREGVGGHGVTALLRGAAGGPVIGVRADMDALGMTEATGCPFASLNNGVMHACGHDGHTSVLLATAEILAGLRNHLQGSVKFLFQPSEECTPIGGAPLMIRDGALENPRVDAVIGLHVWPSLPTGSMGLQAGAVSAASDHLKIVVRGRSCHASMPNEGVDAIVAASNMVMALQTIVSRNVPPTRAAVVTLGTVQGGSRYNVLPERVDFEGTVRSFDPEEHRQLPEWIERVARCSTEALGATAEVDYERGYPPTINDAQIVERLQNAAAAATGDHVKSGLSVPPSGEDFSFFAQARPSAFAWLGCRPADVAPEAMPPLHNPAFLPDPACLIIGVRYFCEAVFDLTASLKEVCL